MTWSGAASKLLKERLWGLIEAVMLAPGTVDAVRLLIVLRYFILVSNVIFIAYMARTWIASPLVIIGMCAIDFVVLLVTLILRWGTRSQSPKMIRLLIIGAFLSDLTLETIGLMSSGLGHSTIVVIPLLSLMSAALVLDLRGALVCAAYFGVAYPVGGLIVGLGLWPYTVEFSWGGVHLTGSYLGLFTFIVSQEVYFILVLAPVLVLISRLRDLFRNFEARLEKASKERRHMEERIHQAQKLESLGLLAGGIAHDFNNILVGIMGRAELATMESPPGSRIHRSSLDIVSASRRAADLCQQMLTYSGQSSLSLAPVNVSEIVQEMPALLGAALPKTAELSYKLDPAVPLIEADPAQIRHVAMNLIINAAESIGEQGGRVTVTSGASKFEGPWPDDPALNSLEWFDSTPTGPCVYLRVADDGCGMDHGTMTRMFDPFFTTKLAGRGLGLSAVVGIVNSHRGLIRVASRPGVGTKVTVAFPTGHTPRRRRTTLRDEAKAWRGSGTVLVIDDEPSVLEVLRDMLTIMGFKVLMAHDGDEGVVIFQEHAAEIRFVLCDLAMPRMGGDETLHAIRAIRPDIKCALTSGFSEAEAKRRLSSDTAFRVLRKPFSYVELADTMKSACHPSESPPSDAPATSVNTT